MYLADYHTHSRISPDAHCSMEEMARAAIAAKLDELCFTDHVEPVIWSEGYITCTPTDSYDWAALSAEFRAAKAAVGEELQLRLGAELGDAYVDFSRAERIMETAPELDFVIGSAHMFSPRFQSKDLCTFVPENEQQARDSIEDYLEQVLLLAKWGRFDVLGHLTLPLRYLNERRGYHLTFDGYEAEVEDILKALIQNGCGIELNTNRGNDPLPGAKWLSLYRKLGGEIITLGTDAHTPEYVGWAIRERQDLLRGCGFRRFCTFEKHRPIWHEL